MTLAFFGVPYGGAEKIWHGRVWGTQIGLLSDFRFPRNASLGLGIQVGSIDFRTLDPKTAIFSEKSEINHDNFTLSILGRVK